MRTPERCPWCGAEPTDGEPSPYWGDQDYRCGAEMVGSEWACTCPDRDTPAAAAYRQTLAWRKRLSQHTGVPVMMVGEPSMVNDFRAEWEGLQLGVQFRVRDVAGKAFDVSTRQTCLTMGGECTEEQCFDWNYWITEARRRLLANGGER